MEPAESIERLGFPRWYERQLIQSHSYLVTCFLCIVLVATCIEEVSSRASRLEHVLMAALILGAAALGVYSLDRYRAILVRAEDFARCATCKTCATYGRIMVVESRVTAADAPEEEFTSWMKVQCRKCGHTWSMG